MNEVLVLPEPALEFRYGQGLADPHQGLSLFGPFDADDPSHPASISYGLVGTKEGNEQFRRFAARLRLPIYTDEGLSAQLWPMFPGFEAAFACRWPTTPTRAFQVDGKRLEEDSLDLDPNKRAASVVEHYLEEIRRMHESDERIDVIICVLPDFIYSRCRPLSRIPPEEGKGQRITARVRHQREAGQQDLFNTYDPKIYQYSVDFRRQLKARCMAYGIPIQIIRQSTLRVDNTAEGRNVTPLCDRAWNLSLAIYYKAGGKPWRLKSARDGVCYIGLAYRRKDPGSKSPTAACAAQMFLDSGDGIVFMGKYGPWYSPRKGYFHLTPDAAQKLLEGTLKTYHDLEGPPLKEIFLHCRSGINAAEFSGFQKACPAGVKLVGIRVQRDPNRVRLLREGTRPVIRGTFWPVNTRSGLLWSSGFKPEIGTYDGWETPVPLRIDIQHGDSEITQVAKDILGLTKLNYNACRLGKNQPVTIGFSDAVGEILVANPAAKERSPKFKFYI